MVTTHKHLLSCLQPRFRDNWLVAISQDTKEMASSIASLLKVMTPMNDSNVVQMTNRVVSVDPNTVQGMTNLLRITEGQALSIC